MKKLNCIEQGYLRHYLITALNSAETSYNNLLRINEMLDLLDTEEDDEDHLGKSLACLAVAKGNLKSFVKKVCALSENMKEE